MTAHFTSADTIVPGAGSAKAFDRYAYVSNNPIRFNDPTGHTWEDPNPICPNGCPAFSMASWNPLPRAIVTAALMLTVDAATNGATGTNEAGEWGIQPQKDRIAVSFVPPVVGSISASDDVLRTASKPIKEKAPIVIGETMKRIKDIAHEIDAKWYQAWKMDPWDFDLAMRRNERWIRDKIKQGREIIDIGLDPKRIERSPFYEMEKRIIDEHKYPVKKYEIK